MIIIIGFFIPLAVIVLSTAAGMLGLISFEVFGIVLGVAFGTSIIVAVFVLVQFSAELTVRFAGFAQALGGKIRHNALGGRILCLPHPRGSIEVEYHTLGGGKYTKSVHYTRVALLCGAGELPRQHHVLTNTTEAQSLQPAAANEVAALFTLFGPPTQVRLAGKEQVPSVQVWVPTWLEEPEVVKFVVESARPHLEALAQGPWRL